MQQMQLTMQLEGERNQQRLKLKLGVSIWA